MDGEDKMRRLEINYDTWYLAVNALLLSASNIRTPMLSNCLYQAGFLR
jgi:hypothetical protein